MDDLLALMDGVDDEDIGQTHERRDTTVDAIVSDKGRHQASEKDSISSVRRHGQSSTLAVSNGSPPRKEMPGNGAETVADGKIGIRISNRLISSIELLDLISTNDYRSTASISAMSLVALNGILVEPATVVSNDTVCGKTSIMTVGIVFRNTGTRISSTGSAYCILAVGNLNTGPVVSVFLFGNAYSRLCTKCPPGAVVALIAPSLLSPRADGKDNGGTTVTFSMQDERQLLRLGNARDYATCKATVGRKRADGKWVSNAGTCKNHVDTRLGPYCKVHYKFGQKKPGSLTTGSKCTSSLRKLKVDHRVAQNTGAVRGGFAAPSAAVQIMTLSTPAGPVVTHVPQSTMPTAMQGVASTASTPKMKTLLAPMHMKKKQAPALLGQRSGDTLHGQCLGNVNPYSASRPLQSNRAPLNPINQKPSSLQSRNSNRHRQDWLSGEATSKKNKKPTGRSAAHISTQQKRRAVNMDTSDYNGSVLVPKPNKLFSSVAPALTSRTNSSLAEASSQPSAQEIRNRQKALAQTIKQGSAKTPISGRRLSCVPSKKVVDATSVKDSPFSRFDNIDIEKINATNSRFQSEADAELYAKSRKAMIELERREQKKEWKSNLGGRGANTGESAIEKEWICDTCRRTTKVKPGACLRSSHKVRMKRSVRLVETAANKRLQLQNKNVSDGGLVLGRGIEWGRK